MAVRTPPARPRRVDQYLFAAGEAVAEEDRLVGGNPAEERGQVCAVEGEIGLDPDRRVGAGVRG
jgi:hypothetical protein